jgi:hypothetical protein
MVCEDCGIHVLWKGDSDFVYLPDLEGTHPYCGGTLKAHAVSDGSDANLCVRE